MKKKLTFENPARPLSPNARKTILHALGSCGERLQYIFAPALNFTRPFPHYLALGNAEGRSRSCMLLFLLSCCRPEIFVSVLRDNLSFLLLSSLLNALRAPLPKCSLSSEFPFGEFHSQWIHSCVRVTLTRRTFGQWSECAFFKEWRD